MPEKVGAFTLSRPEVNAQEMMRLLFHITGFTFFPFLLLRGPAHLSRRVLQWLQNTFDCHISLLQLSQDDLAMLVGQYATAEKGSSVAQPMSSLEGLMMNVMYCLPPYSGSWAGKCGTGV